MSIGAAYIFSRDGYLRHICMNIQTIGFVEEVLVDQCATDIDPVRVAILDDFNDLNFFFGLYKSIAPSFRLRNNAYRRSCDFFFFSPLYLLISSILLKREPLEVIHSF